MRSQKRTSLDLTRAELKEREINGEIRKYILESDPQKIPDSLLIKPREHEIIIRFDKAGN